MLELIRRYRALFSIVFVISAIGMVVSMFGAQDGSLMGGSSMMGAESVARVEGEDIPTRELVNVLGREYERMEGLIQQQAKGAQSPEQAQMIRQIMMSQLNPSQVLQRIVYQRFVYSTALKLGIRSAPESVTEMIREIPEFQKEGRFDPVLYRQMVARPALFEEDLRKQVASTLLQKIFDSSLRVVSKAEIENQNWLDRKIIFEVVTLTPDAIGPIALPSVDDLETFKKATDTEARLQSYFNKNIDQFKKAEEVRARHILVKSGSDKDIQKIAQEIREEKITFEEAAKKYSEDASNAGQGGDLGYFARGMMVPEFEKVAFEMKKPNDISDAVKTQFGEHLIQFIDRHAASAKTLADVREEILPKVWQEQQRQARLDALVKDWSAKSTGPSEKDLQAYKLKWEKQAAWSPKDPYLAALGNIDAQLEPLLRLTKEQPFLAKPLPRGDSLVLVRFVSEETPQAEGDPKPGSEGVLVGEEKVSTAYEHFFKTRYEEAEKKKKIFISQDRVAEISKSFQAQQL
jgi:peptidyl-prolyl cis-trans isomerase D